ncbi:hypothetical protein ACLESO_60250, partial [Pyxidicoccus sp. 3LG]
VGLVQSVEGLASRLAASGTSRPRPPSRCASPSESVAAQVEETGAAVQQLLESLQSDPFDTYPPGWLH